MIAGKENILLLSFDEMSGQQTLTNYRNKGYEAKVGASDTDTFILGKNIKSACEIEYEPFSAANSSKS